MMPGPYATGAAEWMGRPDDAALIARAFSAQPTDGNIQDSLGWAQYRQGRFDEITRLTQEAGAAVSDHDKEKS